MHTKPMPFPDPGTEFRLTLNDGTHVLLRPITSADKQLLEHGLARLSQRSRVTRFFSAVPRLSERQLDYLTDIDQRDRAAWGAALDGDTLVGLGIGRFVRLPDEPHVAEVAVTVVDEFQGRGLGSLLLALLYRTAQRAGIERFRALVLFENQRLIESLQALGGTLSRTEEGAVTIDVPVVDVRDLPETPQAEMLRTLLARVDAALATQASQKDA